MKFIMWLLKADQLDVTLRFSALKPKQLLSLLIQDTRPNRANSNYVRAAKLAISVIGGWGGKTCRRANAPKI